MRKVVVIGGNHHNTLGVIRSLGRGGVFPFVIITSGDKDSFVLKSKYIRKSWVVDDSDQAIRLLLDTIKVENEKIVVIACHDKIASCLDLNRDHLIKYYYLPGTETAGLVTRYMDKEEIGKLASQFGMNVPICETINKDSLPKANVEFPVIIKPIESKDGKKSDIKVLNSNAELLSIIECLKGRSYLLQRFIRKEFEYQLIGCSLNGGEEIIIPGYSRIIRQSKSSNTGFLVYDEIETSFKSVINSTKALLRSLKFSGLFSAEFIRGIDGKDYFLEINFRNDGNTISVANSGVNLPYIWFLSCLGLDYSNEIKKVHREFVMPEFQELALFDIGTISLNEMWRDMRIATSYMDYAHDDPKPTKGWINYFTALTKVLVKRMLKRRKNGISY